MNLKRNIPTILLFTLFAGTLFFIPPIFVNRFTTVQALWMQVGICFGITGYVVLAKERLPFPPKGYIFLLVLWTVFHLWLNLGNIENITTIVTLIACLLLFYTIWKLFDRQLLFILFGILSLILSLWGLAQFAGLLPSYNATFAVTGPFDNPAGLSVSLALLLPFALFICRQKKYRFIAIPIACLIVTVIILSRARTAILASVIVLFLFFIRLLKDRNHTWTLRSA